ncbi:MAG: exodeoxyribonuclease V subunit gamma [Thermodesulfobacteriota bacterium]
MLVVHTSNRLERLLDRLADLLTGPGDPLAPATVLVQSQGMARWLALRLAERLGIAAHLDCPFPSAFIWRLIRSLSPGLPEISAFSPAVLRWAILDEFPRLPQDGPFAELLGYLAADDLPARSFQLAERLADLFDRYLAFRPDWIKAWSAGAAPDDWQAQLWRRLSDRFGDQHRAALQDRLLAHLGQEGAAGGLPLPERICLFGIPTLPPIQMEILRRLAERVEVIFFLLSPCQEYWLDATGHPLLASLGRTGRELRALLLAADAHEEESYEPPPAGTLLAVLQRDLLAGGPVGEDPAPPWSLPPDDRSVQIHAAPSPLREVEILHGRLWDLFRQDPSLAPKDILVMVPEIGVYAPAIEAVFGSGPAEERIPYSIADQGAAATGPTVRAVLELLRLPSGRMPASAVLALLDVPAVARRFRLEEADRGVVRGWLAEAGLHWGLDGAHRAGLGLPDQERGTLQHSLDRLLLGFALEEDETGARWRGILPCNAAAAGHGALLGSLASFLAALRQLAREAARPRLLAAWRHFVLQALEDFFAPEGDAEDELAAVREAMDELAQAGVAAACGLALPLETVLAALAGALAASAPQGSFLCGRVTFCQLVPMRSIPFRVICLLSMNDGDFPRADRPPAFDRLAREPRPGDRSRRDDDRYLFLETLVSARDVLYLSYVGLDERDNTLRPPAVLVTELVAHLGLLTGLSPEAMERRLVTQHPLQPISPRLFAGQPELWSVSREARAAAQALAGGGRPWPGIFAQDALPAPEDPYPLPVPELFRLLCHPVRFLLATRLGLDLTLREDPLADREAFHLAGLARYQLADHLLAARERGLPPAALLAREKEQGSLPQGAYGRSAFFAVAAEIDRMTGFLDRLRQGGPRPDLPVDLDLGSITVTGSLGSLWQQGLLASRPVCLARRTLADRVRFWLGHLLANAVGGGINSFFVGLDGVVRLPAVEDARQRLHGLAAMARAALGRPLPLLPKASLRYLEAVATAGKGPPLPLAARRPPALELAALVWQEGGYGQEPERNEPWLRLAFGDQEPVLDHPEDPLGFATLAEALLLEAFTLEEKG